MDGMVSVQYTAGGEGRSRLAGHVNCQLVARVGNSGRTTGSHLHFEVLLDGAPQDPERFLARGATAAADLAARPRRR